MDFKGIGSEENNLGDEVTFKSIFDGNYQRLVLFADSILLNTSAAEDIVQNIFADFWQSGIWKNRAASMKGYLYKTVKNRCLNEIRNQNVRDTHNLRYVWAMLNVWENGEDDHILLEELKKSIIKLPEQVRRTIELRYFESKSVSETANILNVSPNTVKTQIQRGKNQLFIALSEVRSKVFFALVTLLID